MCTFTTWGLLVGLLFVLRQGFPNIVQARLVQKHGAGNKNYHRGNVKRNPGLNYFSIAMEIHQ